MFYLIKHYFGLDAQGLESVDSAEWQSFDLSQYAAPDQYLTEINVVIKGTGSGAPGFRMLDLRVLGTVIGNPTGVLHVRLLGGVEGSGAAITVA